VAVLKVDGKPYGTSKAELSPDGRILNVENDTTLATPRPQPGKTVEYWDKK